ncbi:MAG: homocitrate synthase [Anaerolineales bacterium]|nr:MAG: homocitrate synthase [Anaerolineales bacterium]
MSLQDFHIIESTLREGEQFVGADFTTEQKVEIARALDAFGVEYIELTSPAASPQSLQDCKTIAGLGLKTRVLTHVRCTLSDARLAVQTGVDGIDVLIGTSSMLREFSHGKDIPTIRRMAREVVSYILDQGLETRFSTEDSFRSNLDDILALYEAVDALGVNRVGVADTVGIASPRQVYDLVTTIKERVSCDIEFHGHNDSGCAIANAFCALEAGATHVDTSILGIGERNGIAPLGGLIARLYATDRSLVTKYRLTMMRDLDNMVAEMVGVDVPFNNYITGITAFTHKAGIHAKAILNNPETYEILDPQDFGMTRYISIAHRLTGWNAIKSRADQLNLHLPDKDIKAATRHIKELADQKPISLGDVDAILRSWRADERDGGMTT